MKIILRADVEKLGSLGDIVDVRPGYGRNFLLPQGMAMVASQANLKQFETERKKLQAKMDAIRSVAKDLAEKITATVITMNVRVGENSKLYGSITTSNICEALAEHDIVVDRRHILLDSSIRTLGEYEVRIRLHADVVATLKLNVEPVKRNIEEAEEAPAAEASAE